MALGPKQMGEAILSNLKKKTGKDIKDWLVIVRESQLIEKKAVIKFLKEEYSLGHFQAQKIFEQFSGQDMYEHANKFVSQLFTSKDTLQIYQKIEMMIKSIGADVSVQPCKTYIPFYRTTQFALVTLNGSSEVVLALNLPEEFKILHFEKKKSVGSVRINFQTIVNSLDEINDELFLTVKQAYLLN